MILKNNPPQGFLDEETRDGYTVSAHMKKVLDWYNCLAEFGSLEFVEEEEEKKEEE